MKALRVKITFTEEVLGMAPNNKEIYREYIAKKAGEAESIEEEVARVGLDAVEDKGKTVFPRTENGEPFFWDYQIKGYFKDVAGMLRRVSGTKSSKLKAYKKLIDGLVFVQERQIPINCSGSMGECVRPLRAATPQGDRVALAVSETCPAGSTIEFSVGCLDESLIGAVKEWLSYGEWRGLGQWRNSGKGTFVWEIATEKQS